MNNKTKKIGIITHYYKSKNYGGLLQAYALPRFLNKSGFDAKQIKYCFQDQRNIDKSNKESIRKKISKLLKRVINFVGRNYHRKEIFELNRVLQKKTDAMKPFQDEIIPHTEEEFFEDNVCKLNKTFDFFITGSDQVFNYSWFRKAYWLTFTSKPKISYAASMALSEIPSDKIEFTKEALKNFQAIGVREELTKNLFSKLNIKNVELNIDPTFLLAKDDWDEISSKQIVREPYVFCYFLGKNKKSRKLAKEYAKKNKLKLVCIPFYNTKYTFPDMNYGDISLPYATPEDFVSLIKYADAVFTDSFHACVFSIIYSKQFVVFNRDDRGLMSSRLTSLMKLFRIENRFLNNKSKYKIKDVEKLLISPLKFETKDFDELKERSIRYLFDNLSDN